MGQLLFHVWEKAGQCSCNAVGREFACARQVTVESAIDFQPSVKQSAQAFFYNGLPLLDNNDCVAGRCQFGDFLFRERVLRYLKHAEGASFGEAFFDVVGGDA